MHHENIRGNRTHINRITNTAPFCVEPHRPSKVNSQHERKDSNPVRQFWKLPALPGAHSCKSFRQETGRESNPRFNLHRVACCTFTLPASSKIPTIRCIIIKRKERESNPQGLSAHPLSKRVPSPVGWPFLSKIRHRLFGHKKPRPGVEPGPSRSKREMMSISPPRRRAEGEGVEPAFPVGKPR